MDRVSLEKFAGGHEGSGDRQLVAAVILQAVEDFRDPRQTPTRENYREDAYYFLRGRKGSQLDYWCGLIGVSWQYVHKGLDKELLRYELRKSKMKGR